MKTKSRKGLIISYEMPRIFIPFIVCYNLIIKHKDWGFHEGGFGEPHINNLHSNGNVMIHFPILPIYFTIQYGDYGNAKTIYPIITYPIIVFGFYINLLLRLIFKFGA